MWGSKLNAGVRLAVALGTAAPQAACAAADTDSAGAGDAPANRAAYARLTFMRVPASVTGLDYSASVGVPLADIAVELTDGEGIYHRTSDAQGLVELPAELADTFQLITRARSLDGQIEIYDYEAGAPHTWQSPSIERVGPPVVEVRIPSGWVGDGYREPRAAAPFAVLDTARRVLDATERRATLPALRVNWSERNLPVWGNPEAGLIGTTRWDGSVLHLLGAEDLDTDEYDEGVIAHELGHFVLEALGRNASPGGAHALDVALDARVAFTEGFANFFAAHSLGIGNVIDTFGPRQSRAYQNDVEGAAEHAGWFSERAIQGLLNDLANTGGSPGRVGEAPLGLRELLNALEIERADGQGFTTIFSFLQAWRAVSGVNASALDDVVRRYAIEPAADALGRGETNDGGQPGTLPLYRELDALGRLEFDLHGDTPNGLTLVRFFTFVAAETPVLLSVEASREVELAVQGPGLPARRTASSLKPSVTLRGSEGERYVLAIRSSAPESENRCVLRWVSVP